MTILTIRLDDTDKARIDKIKKRNEIATTNGAIKRALAENEYHTALLHDLGSLFTREWKVDQAKLKKLNHEFGFIQTNLYDD